MTGVQLVTIVVEAILEDRLLRDLRGAGATGWTLTVARGAGPRGRRAGDLEGGNIRCEVVCSPAVCAAIMQLLEAEYFPHYAAIAWTTPVEVVRGERYLDD